MLLHCRAPIYISMREREAETAEMERVRGLDEAGLRAYVSEQRRARARLAVTERQLAAVVACASSFSP